MNVAELAPEYIRAISPYIPGKPITELAREMGLTGLTLCSSRNALSFYLRHGYAIVTMASRPLPGGVSLPVCLMAKTIGP